MGILLASPAALDCQQRVNQRPLVIQAPRPPARHRLQEEPRITRKIARQSSFTMPDTSEGMQRLVAKGRTLYPADASRESRCAAFHRERAAIG